MLSFFELRSMLYSCDSEANQAASRFSGWRASSQREQILLSGQLSSSSFRLNRFRIRIRCWANSAKAAMKGLDRVRY